MPSIADDSDRDPAIVLRHEKLRKRGGNWRLTSNISTSRATVLANKENTVGGDVR